jgi:hypothetical protein
MSLTQEQKDQISKLLSYRDDIVNSLFQIESILKHYFPEEFEIAYQHYLPQIITALYEDKKWLSRGRYTLEQTIKRLIDKTQEENRPSIKKFI